MKQVQTRPGAASVSFMCMSAYPCKQFCMLQPACVHTLMCACDQSSLLL